MRHNRTAKPNAHPLQVVDRSLPARRSGFTLIEVIATVALLLILAVSTAGILSAITDIGKRNGRAQQARTSIERLSKIFREDVREADDMVIPESDWPLELRSTTSVVKYDWDPEKQTFRRSRSKTDPADKMVSQTDRFLLPESCQPQVSRDGRRVTLQIQCPQLQSPWAIEANLNRAEGEAK